MLASMVWHTLINVNFIVIWYRFVFVLFCYIFSYLFMNSFIYLSVFFSPKFKFKLFWEAKVLFVVITVIFMHLVLLLSDSCFGQRQEESFPSATKVNVCPVGYEHVSRSPPTRRANTWSNISRMRRIVSPPHETLRRELKIRRAAEYFWLTSKCFIWWRNTVCLEWEIKNAKMGSFSFGFQTLIKLKFPLHFFHEFEKWRRKIVFYIADKGPHIVKRPILRKKAMKCDSDRQVILLEFSNKSLKPFCVVA